MENVWEACGRAGDTHKSYLPGQSQSALKNLRKFGGPFQEVLWLRGILKELGLYSSLGSTVYGDNQSAIAVSKNGVKGERTKHVDVKYHFITETVESGVVQLQWIPTLQQQADIFTKALAVPGFEHLRGKLMSH
jgi:hypothetical protein